MGESDNPVGTWSSVTASAMCFVLCLFSAAPCGCGRSTSLSDRNFTRTIKFQGEPTIKIDCEYVGKRPGDPSNFVSNHDYRKIDTDFYRLTMENLTDQDIVIERVEFRMEKGPMRGPKSVGPESIRKTWGTNTIPAASSISRANNMAWSTKRENRFLKTYHFRFASDEQIDNTFTAEVPLVYNR